MHPHTFGDSQILQASGITNKYLKRKGARSPKDGQHKEGPFRERGLLLRNLLGRTLGRVCTREAAQRRFLAVLPPPSPSPRPARSTRACRLRRSELGAARAAARPVHAVAPGSMLAEKHAHSAGIASITHATLRNLKLDINQVTDSTS